MAARQWTASRGAHRRATDLQYSDPPSYTLVRMIRLSLFTTNDSTQYNNLTERNEHRKGLPDLVTTFLDTRHHKPSLDFIARFSMITLGRSKENKDWQVLTILIGLSLVLKSFMKNLFITKSSEFRSFLFNNITELANICF